MSSKPVTEEQLRERLLKAGKTSEEIEQLIDQYAEASRNEFPDTKAISEILRKSQEDSMLRVKGFKLIREQYDALLSHYEESDKLVPGQQVDANMLVEKALEEFINLLS